MASALMFQKIDTTKPKMDKEVFSFANSEINIFADCVLSREWFFDSTSSLSIQLVFA